MIGSIYSGITGMKAFQDALGVTSNNIANAQTTGFKGKKAVFEDLFYQSSPAKKGNGDYAGINPQSTGGGVKIAAIRTDYSQGTLNGTGGKTDVGIEGEGYFVLGDINGQNNEYTKKGSFQLSENNRLVSDSGQYVLGWNSDVATGQLDTLGRPEPLYVQLDAAVKGEATTEAELTGNLNNNMEIGESTRIQFPSYDDAGNRTNIELELVKTGDNTYRYAAIPNESFLESASIKSVFLNTKEVANLADFEKGEYIIETTSPTTPGGQATINVYKPSDTGKTSPVLTQTVQNIEQAVTLKDAAGNNWMTVDYKNVPESNPATVDSATFTIGDVGDIAFAMNGRMESVTPLGYTGGPVQNNPEVTFISAKTGLTNSFNLGLEALTNYNTDTSVSVSEVDGNAAASVRDYSISDDGIILAQYSDGSLRQIGQIAMATFANTQGLESVASGNVRESATSGLPNITVSGNGGAGSIRAQVLENSNVDLASEFVDLMMFQKAFQANTKIIQVSDEVVSGVIGLIR